MRNIIKKIKGKGVVKNHSATISLWVIESDTNDPNGPPIAHVLGPKMRSPYNLDADGFRRLDEKPIDGHSWWWKIWGHTTADITDSGRGLSVDIIFKIKVDKKDDLWDRVIYDKNSSWGVPIRNILETKKDKKGVITAYFIEEHGWMKKSDALKLAMKGMIDNAVIVQKSNGIFYLRSKPDESTKNNFSEIATKA